MDDEFLPTNVIPPHELKNKIFREFLENGLDSKEISLKLNVSEHTVCSYLKKIDLERRADEIKDLVKHAVLEDKVPLLQAIADIGLLSVYEWLSNFFDKGEHKEMKIMQAKNLVELVEKLHNMYRLEIGKSTANIDMMIQKTNKNISVILQGLAAPACDGGDPFGAINTEKVSGETKRE